jgi:hypothetical protein
VVIRKCSAVENSNAQLKKLFNVLGDIEGVAAYTPAAVGKSEQWSAIVNLAEENRQNLCKHSVVRPYIVLSMPYTQ